MQSVSGVDAKPARGALPGAFAPLLYAAVAACAIGLSTARPHLNWDIIGYIAVSNAAGEQDLEALHELTYAELRRSVPAPVFEELAPASGESYRHAIRTNPQAFGEQLPFYRIRPVYNAAVQLLSCTGLGAGRATSLVSGVAVALAMVPLYRLAALSLAPSLVSAFPLAAVAFGALDVARYSTPDGLAFCGVVLSGFLLAAGRTTALLLLLPVLVGVRTDLVLFSLPLAWAAAATARRLWFAAAISAAVSAIAAIAILALCGHPGWAATFHHTFVGPLARPISDPQTVGAAQYLRILAGRTVDLAAARGFVLYAAVAVLSLRSIGQAARAASLPAALRSPAAALSLVCLWYVGSHFLLFPAADDRFFAGEYLLGAYALLALRAASAPGRSNPQASRPGGVP